MKRLSTISLVVFALLATAFNYSGTDSSSFNHKPFSLQLKKYVSAQGNVNYKEWKKEEFKLDRYLLSLSNTTVDEKTWSKDEQKAFWINAYNAFTVKLILKKYPVKSIKKISAKPWDDKFFSIGGKKMSLNDIEHKILRTKFNDPRIHFGIVCASYSCPKLLNEAYTTAKLNAQLDASAKAFINDTNRNKITAKKAQLSEIFSWFKGDFTKKGSLVDYINKYSTVKINAKTKISYLKYNWNLNE